MTALLMTTVRFAMAADVILCKRRTGSLADGSNNCLGFPFRRFRADEQGTSNGAER